jgi:hypothetical protein
LTKIRFFKFFYKRAQDQPPSLSLQIMLTCLVALLLAIPVGGTTGSSIQTFTLHNPNAQRGYTNEVLALPFALAGLSASSLCLTAGGTPAPFQLDIQGGTNATMQSGALYVAATLPPGASVVYKLDSSRACPAPPPPNPALLVYTGDGGVALGNGVIGVVVPFGASAAPSPPPAPFAGFFDGPLSPSPLPTLRGSSAFNLSAALLLSYTGFTSSTLASGPLYVEVLLNYTFFTPPAPPSFASWRLKLALGSTGVEVREKHVGVSVDAGVDIAMHTGGWAPTLAISNGFAYCDPSTPDNPAGMNASSAQLVLPLGPIPRLTSGSLGYMAPRWSQACDSRFYWGVGVGVENSSATLGVLALKGGDWLWPQYRSQAYETMRLHLMGPWSDGGGRGFMHLPLYGRRVWFALVGPVQRTAAVAGDLVQAWGGQALSHLVNVYNLAWPGGDVPLNATYNAQDFFFYSDNTDPTHTVRHQGQVLLQSLQSLATAPPPTLETLAAANTYCDPDWWGSYVGFSSPENPNFFTDWSKLCLGWSLAVALRGHPQAPFYCSMARGVWEADLYHSITMPSGAGQESPGYTAHAMSSWVYEAPLLDAICPNATHPATSHPRLVAGVGFLLRTSNPWAYHFLGDAASNNSDLLHGRMVLPLGDTHPTSTNFTALLAPLASVIPLPNVQTDFTPTELVGFGAVLQSLPGTPRETFFALKASPNRGHNHGDQLSFHYAGWGARIVIDIMAGYLPRPYQEFWHNRLCFGVSQNMDGYERLVAFNHSSGGTVAVGQVSSTRLLSQPPKPPQNYLQVFPTQPLPLPLTYRRTALHIPAPESTSRDYIVLLDAHNASALGVPAYTTLTFFQQDGLVSSPKGGVGGVGGIGLDMGNATLYTFAVDGEGRGVPGIHATLDRWDWASEGNENATRVSVQAPQGDTSTALFITLLYPDGSTMLPVEGQGGGGSSSPTSVAVSNGTLTILFPSGCRDVLGFAGLTVNATQTPATGAGGAAGGTPLVTLRRGNSPPTPLLMEGDVSLSRWQGDIGLDVLDAGYTFGEIPEEVIAERMGGKGQDNFPASYPWPPPRL